MAEWVIEIEKGFFGESRHDQVDGHWSKAAAREWPH